MADDSAFMRRLIADALTRHGAEVVAEAVNGNEAVEQCNALAPDVLCLDLAMPERDGIEVLRELAPDSSMRVVVVSSFGAEAGARAVDALAEGAFDLVPKLSGRGKLSDFTAELVTKVFAAAEATPTQAAPPAAAGAASDKAVVAARATSGAGGRSRVVVIASSTGGPRALTEVVPRLPASTGRGVLVVQHMPAGFTESLAARLDAASALRVVEATAGAELLPGIALVAPGGRHTHVQGRSLTLGDEAPVGGLRPCADVTIEDVVNQFGGDVVLAVLTGMGRDALAGAELVHAAGGVVLAEDPATCTVYGMPKAVIDAGLADEIVPIEEMAGAIARHADS